MRGMKPRADAADERKRRTGQSDTRRGVAGDHPVAGDVAELCQRGDLLERRDVRGRIDHGDDARRDVEQRFQVVVRDLAPASVMVD